MRGRRYIYMRARAYTYICTNINILENFKYKHIEDLLGSLQYYFTGRSVDFREKY